MRIIDLEMNIDGLRLADDESVDDLINKIDKLIDSAYPIHYQILWEEKYEG